MNRVQYWILFAGSSLVVLLLFFQAYFAKQAQLSQTHIVEAQQFIAQGRPYLSLLNQLAGRIYQVSQQTHDQALADVLTRNQIVFKNPATPAPAADASSGSSTIPPEIPLSTNAPTSSTP